MLIPVPSTSEKARPTRTHSMTHTALAVLVAFVVPALCLNNGLGRTPPMGSNPYNYLFFLSPQQWKQTADAYVDNGMKAAGYQYVNQDVNGPGSSYKAVADYVHTKGLKFGVYVMPSRDNCITVAGCQTMANNLATWGVDYLKFDGWTGTPALAFTAMRDALKATNRPIFYNANIDEGPRDGTICNSWRTSGDINGEWGSWTGCLGSNASGAGAPGGWGDPDILTVGCAMASEAEETAQFSLWCVSSSPLLCGNDVRTMFLSTHYILLNTEAIAVNQDTAFSTNSSYGGSGKRIKQSAGQEIWLKTITGGAKAVVLFNTGSASASIAVNWTDIGLAAGAAQVRDLWEHKELGSFTNSYSAQVPSHGCAFVKITAGSTAVPEPAKTWFPKPQDPIPVTPLAKTGWTVTGNLPYPMSGEMTKIIDGDLATSTVGFTPCPTTDTWFAIDMKAPKTFNCVIMSGPNDRVGAFLKPYKAYYHTNLWILAVSTNGTSWTPIDSTWSGPRDYKAFTFADQTAQHIRITRSMSTFQSSYVDNYGAGDNSKYGYCGAALGEVYVAKSDNLPVNARPSTNLGAHQGKGSLRRCIFVGDGRSPGAASLRNEPRGSVFSIDGRRVSGTRGSLITNQGTSVLIVDQRR